MLPISVYAMQPSKSATPTGMVLSIVFPSIYETMAVRR
ncbi:hypothetical protein CEV33_4298 [Brucella grignonensis]|uniref:Uncharacterized protein n=1 Tax=Brucella grignonensis TaxID=94627 RepID=A0A256FN92_9HYPH|nr:hypothetical protein CEV33_4298 [Brucella grignonensis]